MCGCRGNKSEDNSFAMSALNKRTVIEDGVIKEYVYLTYVAPSANTLFYGSHSKRRYYFTQNETYEVDKKDAAQFMTMTYARKPMFVLENNVEVSEEMEFVETPNEGEKELVVEQLNLVNEQAEVADEIIEPVVNSEKIEIVFEFSEPPVEETLEDSGTIDEIVVEEKVEAKRKPRNKKES